MFVSRQQNVVINHITPLSASSSMLSCTSTLFHLQVKRVIKTLLSFLLFTLIFNYASVAVAEGIIAYAGLNIYQASINVDEYGATSIEDEDTGFGLFAASRLYKNLYLEYGYKDLGNYSASYDFTVGAFRFDESHKVDFSQTIYAGFVLKASIGEMMNKPDSNPVFDKIYLHAALGGLLWRAELEMDGNVYDSGTLLSPYGATGDDTGFSSYYELGLGYQIIGNFILSLTWNTFVDVGEGTEMQLLDGSQTEFAGKNVETLGLGLTYMF